MQQVTQNYLVNTLYCFEMENSKQVQLRDFGRQNQKWSRRIIEELATKKDSDDKEQWFRLAEILSKIKKMPHIMSYVNNLTSLLFSDYDAKMEANRRLAIKLTIGLDLQNNDSYSKLLKSAEFLIHISCFNITKDDFDAALNMLKNNIAPQSKSLKQFFDENPIIKNNTIVTLAIKSDNSEHEEWHRCAVIITKNVSLIDDKLGKIISIRCFAIYRSRAFIDALCSLDVSVDIFDQALYELGYTPLNDLLDVKFKGESKGESFYNSKYDVESRIQSLIPFVSKIHNESTDECTILSNDRRGAITLLERIDYQLTNLGKGMKENCLERQEYCNRVLNIYKSLFRKYGLDYLLV